jgi:hypothetical protein
MGSKEAGLNDSRNRTHSIINTAQFPRIQKSEVFSKKPLTKSSYKRSIYIDTTLVGGFCHEFI